MRGSRLVLGRRFGRRFVFGRFWSLLIVVWGAVLVVRVFGRFWSLLGVVWDIVLFWSFSVAFGRRMGRRLVLVVFVVLDAIDAFSWRDRLSRHERLSDYAHSLAMSERGLMMLTHSR